jgi:hypothetical protein
MSKGCWKREIIIPSFTPVIPEFPFLKWGLDFIGPINPPSFVGHIFILTTTYYFMKWVEAMPLKHAKDEQVIYFLDNQYIFSVWITN